MKCSFALDPQVKRAERAILKGIVADMSYNAALLVCLLMTNSLTLLGEIFRSALMSLFDVVTYVVLLNVNREKWTSFEFGTNKLEQLCHLILGLGMVVSALWLGLQLEHKVSSDTVRSTALGFALAAVALSANMTINWVVYLVVRRVYRQTPTPINEAQFMSRRTKLVASLVVQFFITLAVLANESDVASLLDTAGALIVLVILIKTGFTVAAKGLADLADLPPSTQAMAKIRYLVETRVGSDCLVGVRARMSSQRLYVEAFVRYQYWVDMASFQNCQASVEDALRNEFKHETKLQLRIG